MSEPEMDEELLLFCSSPHDHRKNPDDEVRDIVKSLLGSTYLNPIVGKFLEDPVHRDLFLEVFARHANLIKSRCQSFDDGHVTVYDKVLLGLTDNGNRFDSVAAQEYFCEEFLGISKDGNPIEAEKILEQNLVLKAILAQAAYPDGKYGDKYSDKTKYGDKGQHPPPTSAAVASKDDEMNAKIARLTSIYEKAKSDCEAVPAGDTMAKLEAARFLRDTAENTIMYFRGATKGGEGHAIVSSQMKDLMSDLEATCKMAQASVVSLSGGRKRKFDKHDYEVFPRGSPGNGHGENPGRRGGPSRGGGGGFGHSIYAYGAKKWQDTDRDKRDIRRGVELRSQPSGDSRDYPPGDHPPTIVSYARPVDSYQPAEGEVRSSSQGHHYRHHQHQHQHQHHHHHPPSLETPSPIMYGYVNAAQQKPAYASRRYGDGQDEEYGYPQYIGGYGGRQRQYGPEERPEGQRGPEEGKTSYQPPGRRASRNHSNHRRGGGGVFGGGGGDGVGRRDGHGNGHGNGNGNEGGNGNGSGSGNVATGGGYQPQMGY